MMKFAMNLKNYQNRIKFKNYYTLINKMKIKAKYDLWEEAYFKYLNFMYKKIYNDSDFLNMFLFFKYIYSVSSGEISEYVDQMTDREKNYYEEYLIKRYK